MGTELAPKKDECICPVNPSPRKAVRQFNNGVMLTNELTRGTKRHSVRQREGMPGQEGPWASLREEKHPAAAEGRTPEGQPEDYLQTCALSGEVS